MQVKDKLDLSNKNFLDVVVDHRRLLVGVIVFSTVLLSILALGLTTDPTLKSGLDITSEAYLQHEKYTEIFGNEEFILVAIKNARGAGDSGFLSVLEMITQKLEKLDKVVEVVSLSNIRILQQRNERYWTYPILLTSDGLPLLPDKSELDNIRKALPVTDFLLSDDLKTFGILVRINDQYKFDPDVIRSLVGNIEQIVGDNIPQGTEYRIVGAPLIRQAIVKYSIQTGVFFGIICLIIATVVSVYIFKSLKVTAITNVILVVCVVWVLGLMAALGIPLNSTTALSFGFIPLTTLEIVIHMLVRYHQFHQSVRDKTGAIKQTVRWLARPCLICSATTAVGFGTLMIGSIPMVRQLGFIMSVGIMISYCLAMILTPAFFMVLKSLNTPDSSGMLRDGLDQVLRKIEHSIFRYYRIIVATGLVLTVFLFAGTPMIRSDIQLLRMLSDSTKEVQDIKFIEANLTLVNSLELLLEADHNAFKKPEVWKKVWELEKRLKEMPEVTSIDSFLPLLDYLNSVVDPTAQPYTELFAKPRLIPELLAMMSMSEEGKRVIRRFMNDRFDRLRISVRIKNSPGVPIGQTIEEVRATAASVMHGIAGASVTGDLAVVAGQTADLITDQIKSMAIASVLITLLMMLQMGSCVLGLISLIPNIPPVAAVFGMMGWLGISLDGVTVFAATVAIGLAVDNTIHYLTQLKREIRMNTSEPIEECVRQAYRLTAKQIASWSSVILMGFLALAISPFRPVVLFGILGCSAIFLGLFGDLIFIQSLILASSTIRNSIKKLIDKEIAAEHSAFRA